MKYSPCPPQTIAGELPAGGRILEVGCGDGELLRYLSDAGYRQLWGLSPEPKTLPGIETRQGTAEAIPFGDESFDCVILECVFSLCRQEEAAAQICRVLKPGGIFLCADLYTEGPSVTLARSPQVMYIGSRPAVEALLQPWFRLETFTDHTHQLRQMYAQMIWNGTMCSYVAPEEQGLLRKAKACYGLWKWIKR